MDAVDLVPDARADVPSLPGDVPPIERFRGALLGVAVGDALGRPAEGSPPEVVRAVYGSLTDLHPGPDWVATVTDDTEMTLCVARSIVACGGVDPDDIARRFVAWMPHGRGKGRSTVAAIRRLMDGRPWTDSGVPSAGNGAAMRVAPVGLLDATDVGGLRRDAATTAVITHADPMAVVSAVAQAFAVAYLTHLPSRTFDAGRFLAAAGEAIDDLRDPGVAERRAGAGPAPVRLADRLREVGDMLHLSAHEAFARLHNGAFVLESLPAAWWCFLRSPEDPERAIVTAADGGYDADTVASMTGALAGAYHGEAGLPPRWREQVEFRDELLELAGGLHRLAAQRQRG